MGFVERNFERLNALNSIDRNIRSCANTTEGIIFIYAYLNCVLVLSSNVLITGGNISKVFYNK